MSEVGERPMPVLGSKLLDRFGAMFPNLAKDEPIEGDLILRVPACHPEVGDLRVWADVDELTVGIGEHHHGHHSLYMYSDRPTQEAEDTVVVETIEFIKAVFEDRVVLGLSWDGDRLRWSHTYLLQVDDQGFRGAVGYSEYTWHGPRDIQG